MTNSQTLLVIDDDPLILQCMRLCLPEPDYHVMTAESAGQAISAFRSGQPDAVLLDIQLPDQSGLALIHEIRELDGRVPVILMSGGAFDYVTKPFEPDEILPVIDAALETSRMARKPAILPSEREQLSSEKPSDQMMGECPAMVEVFRSIGRVASRDTAVLILGETGTGKEVVARALYQHSSRHDHVFHAINCAAIPEALLESELFGHEKGAFTGAEQRRIGKFEICNGGTLFLDEIGDMTPVMQTKLLRVLQEKEFERVGGSKTIKTDVRIIAATNRDLDSAMADGSFRSDLFYRLNEFTISLPPLRERGQDLRKMTEHFFHLFSRQLKKDFVSIAPETMQRLLGHDWPGNVRELQGIIKQTLLKASGPVILPAFLPSGFGAASPASASASASVEASSQDWQDGLAKEVRRRFAEGSFTIGSDIHDDVDRILIAEVMKSSGNNISEASNRLGISRPTLRSRINHLRIDVT